MTLDEIRKFVAKAHHCDDEGGPVYRCGVVLLASAFEGTTNADELAAFTGYPRSQIRRFSKNLRESGIWSGRKICADWANEEDGWIVFILDSLVGAGLLQRAAQPRPFGRHRRRDGLAID